MNCATHPEKRDRFCALCRIKCSSAHRFANSCRINLTDKSNRSSHTCLHVKITINDGPSKIPAQKLKNDRVRHKVLKKISDLKSSNFPKFSPTFTIDTSKCSRNMQLYITVAQTYCPIKIISAKFKKQ